MPFGEFLTIQLLTTRSHTKKPCFNYLITEVKDEQKYADPFRRMLDLQEEEGKGKRFILAMIASNKREKSKERLNGITVIKELDKKRLNVITVAKELDIRISTH